MIEEEQIDAKCCGNCEHFDGDPFERVGDCMKHKESVFILKVCKDFVGIDQKGELMRIRIEDFS